MASEPMSEEQLETFRQTADDARYVNTFWSGQYAWTVARLLAEVERLRAREETIMDPVTIDRDKRYTDDPHERAKCQTCGKRRRTVHYRRMTNLKNIETPMWLCDPCVIRWAKSGVHDANDVM